MPDVSVLLQRFEALKATMQAKLPDIAGKIALSAKALSERRIKDAGFGKVYSNNRIPSWFLLGKELNAAGTAYLKNKQKQDQKNTHQKDGVKTYPDDYGVNWKEFRQAQGLQTGHVDLTYTGFMFSNMQVVKVQADGPGTFVQAFLGGTNIEAQNKMNWNRDRFGDFIRAGLTTEDNQALNDVAIVEINSIITQFKL